MRYFIALLILSLIVSCNSGDGNSGESEAGPDEPPRIRIVVKGTSSGQARLIGTLEDQQFRVDSATVNASGVAVFTREEPYEPGYYFVIMPDMNQVQLLLDQDQEFTLETNAGKVIADMKVTGSLDNELLYRNLRFEQQQRPLLTSLSQRLKGVSNESPQYQELKSQQDQLAADRKAHLEKIFEEYPDAFFTKFKKAGQNPEVKRPLRADGTLNAARQLFLYRTELWDNVDFSDERLLRTPVIFNKLRRYITELVPQHPDSIIRAADHLLERVNDYPEYYRFFVNWIGLNYEPGKSTLMDAEAIYVHIVQNYITKDRAFWLQDAEIQGLQQRAGEMAASLIGKKGPDVESTDPQGRSRSIYEIDAPYIIVFLFNPDCEHCIEETPKLVRFYRDWKRRGVEVFAIAIDTDADSWKRFIAQNNMDWINVFDPTNKSFYGKYFVDNTPEIYVLNPDRIIVGKNLKVFQIEEIIRKDREG
jgi:peroxiredoxin